MKPSLVDRIIIRLFSRYEILRERNRQTSFRRTATLASTAQVGPEGTIANILGDPRAVSIGEHSFLRGRLITYGHGGKISIGDWCYVGERSEIWSMNCIEIGDRVLISHDVNIHDGTAHSMDAAQRHAHYRAIVSSGHPRVAEDLAGLASAPIVIEDDVWISFGVTILKGVRIGRGSIIAARSIVNRDVPPGMLFRCQVVPIVDPIS